MIENAGCEVLYLPAYSPDFNPIEHYWAQVKSHLRKLLKQFTGDLYQAAAYLFQHILT